MLKRVKAFSKQIADGIKRSNLQPTEINNMNFCTTYRCNSRCIMCNIWKKPTIDDNELSLSEIKRFFSNKMLEDLKTVQLTGGELFLRRDIVSIVQFLHWKFGDLGITVSSNGFLTDTIVKDVKEIVKFHDNFNLAISIDGLNDMHDKVRSVPNAFKMATTTLLALKDYCSLQVSFCATPLNFAELPKVKQWADDNGFRFAFQVQNVASAYFHNAETACQWNNKDRNLFSKYLLALRTSSTLDERLWIDSCLNQLYEQRELMPCFAGFSSFCLNPYGDIYPCVTSQESFGNVRRQMLSEVWFGQKATSVRRKMLHCSSCCLGCEFGNNVAHGFIKYKYSFRLVKAKSVMEAQKMGVSK